MAASHIKSFQQTSSDKRRVIHAVAGIVYNAQRQILIALRPEGRYLAGYWEFPGGKVEAGESAPQALQRELQEEVGIYIDLEVCQPFLKLSHDYPDDKTVILDVWAVDKFSGQAYGAEGQSIQWVDVEQLSQHEFPAANIPVIDALLNMHHVQKPQNSS